MSRLVTFDYVAGRPLKVKLDLTRKVILRADLYDRDAGEGMCERVIARSMRDR